MNVFPKDKNGNIILQLNTFASKAVTSGKLFRRKHGFASSVIAANSEGIIDLVVPYNQVKINEFELINGQLGDKVDLKVLDTPTGTLSTIPNFMLNQFGFNVELPNGFYRDVSDYDADLIKDMTVRIVYKNNSSNEIIVRGNITYHEVKL